MSSTNISNGGRKTSRQNSHHSTVSNEISPAGDEGGLKKSLNLGNAIAIIVGSIVGSGIFVSPKGVTVQVQSFGMSLVMWLVSGLISMLGAMCFAELALLIPSSGGEYMYVYKAMGPCCAFLRLWMEIIIIRPSIAAVLSIVFANYILVPLFPSCDPPSTAIRLLAALAILLIGFINCASVKLSAKIQNVFTAGKMMALGVIIITGVVKVSMGTTENFYEPFDDTASNPANYALATIAGLFSFFGWNFLSTVTEELKNPKRDIPLSIIASLVVIIFIYLLTIASYQTSVSTVEMINHKAIGVLFAERNYSFMWWILPLFVVMSVFGTINGVIFTTARMTYVGGRNGHLPEILNMVQTNLKTPITSVIFFCAVSVFYLIFDDIFVLMTYLSFVQVLAFQVAIAILIYFKVKHPERNPGLKFSLAVPVLFLLITAVLDIFCIIGKPVECMGGVLMIFTGLPFYLFGVIWSKKPKSVQANLQSFYQTMQKLFLVVPESQKKTDL